MDAVLEDRYQIIETLRIPSWQSITGGELQCLRALGVSGRQFSVWGLHSDGQPQALDLDYLESISSAVAFDGLLGLETLYLRGVDAAAR